MERNMSTGFSAIVLDSGLATGSAIVAVAAGVGSAPVLAASIVLQVGGAIILFAQSRG